MPRPRPALPLLLATLLLASAASAKDISNANAGTATAAQAAGAEPAPADDWSDFVPPTDGSFLTSGSAPDLGLVKRLFALTFAEECSDALDDGSGGADPEVYDITYRESYDAQTDPERLVKLYRFFCFAGAYNEVAVYMTWDSVWGLRPLLFAEPSLDVHYEDDDFLEGPVKSIAIKGFVAQATLVNSYYDAATRTIGSFSKWRGIGDASSSAVYAFDAGQFILKTFDADASYDGEINPVRVIDLTAPQPVELKVLDTE